MQTYIALLRGINVSGKNSIKMAELKKELSKIDLHNIITYIQSGNVIFKSSETRTAKLEENIQNQIKTAFSYDVPVLVMSIEYLENTIANTPYATEEISDPSKFHLTFLADDPDQTILQDLKPQLSSSETWTYKNRVIYLHCPDGYGRTKFNNNFFEKKLKVPATTRNWKSSNKLLELSRSI